jgi:hypothetical protein
MDQQSGCTTVQRPQRERGHDGSTGRSARSLLHAAAAGRPVTHSWLQLKANERPAGRHVALPAALLHLHAVLLYHKIEQ